jgi:hypothetical protein
MQHPPATDHASRGARAPHLLAITLILLLAAGMRILGAADRPVWTDEGFMAWITGDLDVDTVVERAETWDRHAPMYVFVVGGWREIAGDSRIALRFWAIMSGIVATALVYRLGADAFGALIGRYAAMLFAVLKMAVYYGQEIRGYGWLIMAVCWMALFFLRYLRHPRPIYLVGLTLSVALMLYTVYLGVLILAVMGLITLVWRGTWRHRFALLGAVLAGIALFTPWLIVILRNRARVQSGIAGAPGTYATTWENIRILSEFVWGQQLALALALWVLGAWALGRAMNHREFLGQIARYLPGHARRVNLTPRPPLHSMATGSQVVRSVPSPSEWGGDADQREAGEGLVQPHTIPPKSKRSHVQNHVSLAGLFFILAGAGVFSAMIVANLWIAIVAARTLVFVTPFVMLVCGAGLAQIAPPARAVFAAILVGLSLVTSPVIQPRLAYDDTAEALAAEFSRGDLVILETGWDDNPFAYELSLALPDGTAIIRTLPWVDPGNFEPVVPQVEPAIRAHDRVWIVQWLTPSQVIPWLDSGEAGFRRVLAWDISVGKQYIARYPDYPPTVYIALYERPALPDNPDDQRIYGDQLVLHGAVIAERAKPGERLHVDLWWSAAERDIERDYSVGVYLMPPDEDRVIAQHDGPPGDVPTSQWSQAPLYFDRHTLTVPDDLARGTYRVAVGVYWFGDEVPLQVDGGDFAVIGEIDIR